MHDAVQATCARPVALAVVDDDGFPGTQARAALFALVRAPVSGAGPSGAGK